MALKAAASSSVTVRRQAFAKAVPALTVRRATVVRAQVKEDAASSPAGFGNILAITSAATTLMTSGNALAATELMQLADNDSRGSLLLTLFVPALGWVAFNIAGGLFNQLDVMGEQAKATPPESRSVRVKRSVAGALGLGMAGLLASTPADAATQLAQIAESDNRASLLLTLFVPALAWVAFNIAGGLFNQLDVMGDQAKATPPESRSVRVKRSVAGALGLGMAGLLASAPAEAATQLAQIAESDNRAGLLLTLFVPALGWVGFNILGGLNNQLSVMGEQAKATPPSSRSVRVKRSVAGALGLGMAGLLASAPAEAATQLAQIAESDNRAGLLLTLFVPALGWVGFNILGGLNNQLSVMGEQAKATPPSSRSVRVKRSVAGALGLGMAGLLASAPAEAATQLAQIAESDNRAGLLLTLFVPALGWVGFNILGGLNNQLSAMSAKAKDTPPEARSIRK